MRENLLSKTNRMITCDCGNSFYIDYLYAERYPSRYNHKPYRMYCNDCGNFVYFDENDGESNLSIIIKQKIKIAKHKLVRMVKENQVKDNVVRMSLKVNDKPPVILRTPTGAICGELSNYYMKKFKGII